MSVTTSLVCDDCKECVWIGQGQVIYTGDPDSMEWMTKFLYKHKDHPLRFRDEHWLFAQNADYWDIEDGVSTRQDPSR